MDRPTATVTPAPANDVAPALPFSLEPSSLFDARRRRPSNNLGRSPSRCLRLATVLAASGYLSDVMETALLRDVIPQDAQLRQQAGALPLPPHSAASPPSPALFRIAATWAVVHRPLRTVATPCSDSPAARISWMADGTRAACSPAFADHAALAGDRT